jgi:pantothenate kinase
VQDPVAGDIKISSRNKIVIIEGNYTLFDESPWNRVGEKVDERYVPRRLDLSHRLNFSK